jgi:20S proteasome subunit beta 6
MPLRAIARLIQTMLYGRRFFPYYVYNILGGIEDDGCISLLLLMLSRSLK